MQHQVKWLIVSKIFVKTSRNSLLLRSILTKILKIIPHFPFALDYAEVAIKLENRKHKNGNI